MKKLLLLAFSLVAKFGIAQIYQQGDIFVNTIFNGNHDSTQCGTNGMIMYDITVSNSFVGDSLLVKDPNSNVLIMAQVNSSGMNPWFLSIPAFGSAPFVPDYLINAGNAEFFAMPVKLKNGLDSIDNMFSFFQVPVTNPCGYGTMSGRVYIDNNNDCSYNVGDGFLLDFFPLSVSANYTGSFFDFYSYSVQTDGLYTMQVQSSYLTNGQLTYNNGILPFAFPNACTPSIYNFDAATPFPVNNVDFVLQCTSNIDLGAYVMSSGPVRPAIPFMLYPHAYNMGCDTVSGSMQLILDSRVSLNTANSTNLPSSINGDTLTWYFGPLSNLSSNGFWNSMTSGLELTPDSTVAIGDTLCFAVSVNNPSADINLANNQFTWCAPVVNSYDPNMKEVSPKGIGPTGIIPPNTSEIRYTIHFQNTGNAPAINVSILDTLDVSVVPESIEIIGSSHTLVPEWIAPGILKFNFDNINLPDSLSNEPASHGFVSYKIKLDNNLNLGTVIENTAYIYFDLNPAIVTNTAMNIIDQPTGLGHMVLNDHVSVFPNPAFESLTIFSKNNTVKTKYSIEVFDITGNTVLALESDEKQTQLDISSLSKGIYVLKVVDGTASNTIKFVKE